MDAAALPAELTGFRTIFTSFHHFTPDEAVAILQNAADDGQGIGVFEAAKRDPLTILLTVLMPLAGFLTAPFARPFRISRLFWTYIIPVIPFVLFFDGVVSCLRAYSQKELSLLAAQVKADNYVWQIGEQSGGLAPVTFLVGYPAACECNYADSVNFHRARAGEMSRQTIHRIYTEDKRRATIVRVISKQFESFTLQPTTGYYRGKPEKSIVLEIVGAKESQVKWLAARIREINRQASVLVIT